VKEVAPAICSVLFILGSCTSIPGGSSPIPGGGLQERGGAAGGRAGRGKGRRARGAGRAHRELATFWWHVKVQKEGAALAAGVQARGQGVEETHGRLQGFRRCRGRAGAGRRRSWWPAAAPVRGCEGRRRAGTRGKFRAGYVGSRDAMPTVSGRFYMGTGARVQGEGGVQKKQTGAGVRLADFYRAKRSALA
jgi:hypothetical protein